MPRLGAATTVAVVLVLSASTALAQSPEGSPAMGGSPAAGGWDPSAVTGSMTLSGWQSTGAEGEAVEATVAALTGAYPNIQVNYEPIPGDYVAAMTAAFASGDVPDLFYVNADYAQEWIAEGFLRPIDDLLAQAGFDTSTFFPAGLEVFTGDDGQLYGLPKDFNTIALAYNTELVPEPPATLDDLVAVATQLQEAGNLQAPMCLNPGLDRGLAFVYAQGGSLLTEDGSASAITTPESVAAVQWYLDLFRNGLGMTASDLGAGWCGDALGTGSVAMIFEGGWLDPAMTGTYPDTPYAWAQIPTGSIGEPVTLSYTVSYSIGADSANVDPALVGLTYLTGPEGMGVWTQGGVALPSRSDVPIPEGKDVLAASSAFARPGSGFMPRYTDVLSAFGNAFTEQVQNQTFEAGPVTEATDAAIATALGS
jgi:multiple sugar transport system substrate-binding protein